MPLREAVLAAGLLCAWSSTLQAQFQCMNNVQLSYDTAASSNITNFASSTYRILDFASSTGGAVGVISVYNGDGGHEQNVSALAGTTWFPASALAMTLTSSQNIIVYRSGSGGTAIHRLMAQNALWSWADLSQKANAPPAAGDPFLLVSGSLQIVAYLGAKNNHVYELYSYDNGKTWSVQDLFTLVSPTPHQL
jgi:hypothetical protein